MKKTPSRVREPDDIRTEYDFSGGIRGKYAKHFAEGATAVVLEPDVARAFPTSGAVNEALRGLIAPTPARKRTRKTSRRTA